MAAENAGLDLYLAEGANAAAARVTPSTDIPMFIRGGVSVDQNALPDNIGDLPPVGQWDASLIMPPPSQPEEQRHFIGDPIETMMAVPEGLAGAALKTKHLLDVPTGTWDAAMTAAGMSALPEFRKRSSEYIEQQLEQWARPDPRYNSGLADTIRGAIEGLSLYAGGTLAAGPMGGVAAVSTVEGYDLFKETKKQTGDTATSAIVGLAGGALLGAGAFLPMKVSPKIVSGLLARGAEAEAAGNTALAKMFTAAATASHSAYGSVATGSGMMVGFGAANRATIGSILRNAGYEDVAKHYDPLDGYAMLADAVLGGAFGAVGHNTKTPDQMRFDEDLSNALTDAYLRQRNAQGLGVPVTGEAGQAHAGLMSEAVTQLMEGRSEVTLPEDALTAVVEGSIDNPNARVMAEENAAAVNRVLDQYPALADAVRELTPTTEATGQEPPPPRQEPLPDDPLAELEPLQQATLHDLTNLHPDTMVSIGDNVTVPLRDLPDIIRRFAQDDNALSQALTAGINCFIGL